MMMMMMMMMMMEMVMMMTMIKWKDSDRKEIITHTAPTQIFFYPPPTHPPLYPTRLSYFKGKHEHLVSVEIVQRGISVKVRGTAASPV